MQWKGHELVTMGDVLSAARVIVDADDKEQAQEFLALYRTVTPYADENLGYGFRYFSREAMVKGLALFDLTHPVLGDAGKAAQVTPQEAFERGMQIGEEIRRRSTE